MSALGQKQTRRAEIAMSAVPPEADIPSDSRDVCFVPDSDIERNCLPNLFQAAA